MKRLKVLAGGILLIALLAAASAQRRRDPLTELEADQLRDAALDAETRLKLYVDFARVRLTRLEQACSDSTLKGRGSVIHDRLQDFLDVYDELNDNLDNFEKRGDDLRRPLKLVMDADIEFQSKFRAVKQASENNAEGAKEYEFLLSSVQDTLHSSAQDHRELMTEEQEAAKHKKK